MLDVHPPHEATHTWTDFFIHIATIVVGLHEEVCQLAYRSLDRFCFMWKTQCWTRR